MLYESRQNLTPAFAAGLERSEEPVRKHSIVMLRPFFSERRMHFLLKITMIGGNHEPGVVTVPRSDNLMGQPLPGIAFGFFGSVLEAEMAFEILIGITDFTHTPIGRQVGTAIFAAEVMKSFFKVTTTNHH